MKLKSKKNLIKKDIQTFITFDYKIVRESFIMCPSDNDPLSFLSFTILGENWPSDKYEASFYLESWVEFASSGEDFQVFSEVWVRFFFLLLDSQLRSFLLTVWKEIWYTSCWSKLNGCIFLSRRCFMNTPDTR